MATQRVCVGVLFSLSNAIQIIVTVAVAVAFAVVYQTEPDQNNQQSENIKGKPPNI